MLYHNVKDPSTGQSGSLDLLGGGERTLASPAPAMAFLENAMFHKKCHGTPQPEVEGISACVRA